MLISCVPAQLGSKVQDACDYCTTRAHCMNSGKVMNVAEVKRIKYDILIGVSVNSIKQQHIRNQTNLPAASLRSGNKDTYAAVDSTKYILKYRNSSRAQRLETGGRQI